MSIKKIFLYYFILSVAMNSISSKEENGKRFLSNLAVKNLISPISYLNEAPEIKSFAEDDTKVINIKCLFSKNYNMYSLQPLQNNSNDYDIDLNNEEKLYFNFCRNTLGKEDCTFFKKKIDGTEIKKLSGSIEGDNNNKNTWEENGDGNGITITFNQGESCPINNTTKPYQVILKINCNSAVDENKFKESPKEYMNITDFKDCILQLEMESLYGCSLKSSYLLLKLLEDYKIIFAIIFVVVGLILCFMGNRFITYTIVIVCGFIGCYAITAAVLNFLPDFITTETWLLVCLLVCFVLGCILGYFLKGEVQFSIILFGGFLGYSCAIFVYQIVLNYIEYDPEIVYYACIGVCIVVGVILGWKLSKPIIIIGTSVFGGYLAMRGVSFIAGNYLDEGLIIDLIKNKEYEQLKEIRDGWTYAYLGSWIILSIAGIIIQCKNNKKSSSKDTEKK